MIDAQVIRLAEPSDLDTVAGEVTEVTDETA